MVPQTPGSVKTFPSETDRKRTANYSRTYLCKSLLVEPPIVSQVSGWKWVLQNYNHNLDPQEVPQVTKYLDFSGSDINSNCTFHCGFSGPIWVVPLSGSALSIGNTPQKKKHGFVKSGSRKSGIFGGNQCVSFKRGKTWSLFWGADSPRSLTNSTPEGWPFGKVVVLRWDDLGMIHAAFRIPYQKPMVLATNKLANAKSWFEEDTPNSQTFSETVGFAFCLFSGDQNFTCSIYIVEGRIYNSHGTSSNHLGETRHIVSVSTFCRL